MARALARTFGASLDVVHVAENIMTRALAGESYLAIVPELQTDLERSAREQLDRLLMDNDRRRLPRKAW